MRLYEFEAKKLFKRYTIPVLDGIVLDSANLIELSAVVFPVVIKAQVFLGGRGKSGLIKIAENRKQAENQINAMFGQKHGPYIVEKVLVERKIDFEKEIYIAATIDRLEHKLLFIASEHGGVEIEVIAEENPESLLKYCFNPNEKMPYFMARNIACDIGASDSNLIALADIINKAYKLFIEYDCKLVEINPLVFTRDGKFYALDAKVDLDEDAMFRHPGLKEMGIRARHEIGELTEREKFAKEKGIPYVDMDGDIGVFPGGAGFGIAAVDLITLYGGKPANFMDSGGAPTQEKLKSMLGLLIENPKVKAIFGARFGGISRCDDWAKAVVQYITENKPEKPMIMRMAGNMEEQGRKILEQAKADLPQLFSKIKIYSVNTPIEEVIQETIKIAKRNNKMVE
ncbi:MAG: succinate--CoA ligase subunit beta [bacterium]